MEEESVFHDKDREKNLHRPPFCPIFAKIRVQWKSNRTALKIRRFHSVVEFLSTWPEISKYLEENF